MIFSAMDCRIPHSILLEELYIWNPWIVGHLNFVRVYSQKFSLSFSYFLYLIFRVSSQAKHKYYLGSFIIGVWNVATVPAYAHLVNHNENWYNNKQCFFLLLLEMLSCSEMFVRSKHHHHSQFMNFASVTIWCLCTCTKPHITIYYFIDKCLWWRYNDFITEPASHNVEVLP